MRSTRLLVLALGVGLLPACSGSDNTDFTQIPGTGDGGDAVAFEGGKDADAAAALDGDASKPDVKVDADAGKEASAEAGDTGADHPTPEAGVDADAAEDVDAGEDAEAGEDAPAETSTDGCVPTGVELCDGVDNDCNGSIDDLAAQGCYTGANGTQGVGPCHGGTQTCSNGAWGTCTGEVIPATETCDGVDNDCSGQVDDNVAPQACYTGANGTQGVGPCHGGTQTCSNGAWGTCTGEVVPATETCDGVDNDCSGQVDDNVAPQACYTGPNGTQGVGVCHGGTQTCTGGGWGACTGQVVPSNETCNGADDNCNGQTDENNPGGGVLCGTGISVGACTAKSMCINGQLQCLGTFVAPPPTGSPNNTGASNSPLSTINAAQAHAVTIGGGADVCACSPNASTSTWTEDLTMVEAVSVLGGYHCTDWARAIATYVTRIQDTTVTGVKFPTGITAITALDGFTVRGLTVNNGTSAAITITQSSPSLLTLNVSGGAAPTSYGLDMTGPGSPILQNGTYGGTGAAGGTQIAVRVNNASPALTSVTMVNAPSSGGTPPNISVGLRCTDCANMKITGGAAQGGQAANSVAGMWLSGNVAGVTVTGPTNVAGGQIGATGANNGARGAWLDACNGLVTFTGTSFIGGAGQNGFRIGFDITGSTCSASVTGGAIRGCEMGSVCVAAESVGSPLTLSGVNPIIGVLTQASIGTVGVRCLQNGCTTIDTSTISSGALTAATGQRGIGVEVSGSIPTFDRNNIQGPPCQGAIAATELYGVFIKASAPTFTNNVVRDGACSGPEEGIRYEKGGVIPVIVDPVVVNNTIEYGCNTCGTRRGIVIVSPGATTTASGFFNNNIVRNLGNGAGTWAGYEVDAGSAPKTFLNNDLFDGTATALYLLGGTTGLTTIGQVNAQVNGAGGNISADPLLNASWHIPVTSPCRNAGSVNHAPKIDFDNDVRPQEVVFDIGADEYHP